MPKTEAAQSPPLTTRAENKARVTGAQGKSGRFTESRRKRMLGGQSQQTFTAFQAFKTAGSLLSSIYSLLMMSF